MTRERSKILQTSLKPLKPMMPMHFQPITFTRTRENFWTGCSRKFGIGPAVFPLLLTPFLMLLTACSSEPEPIAAAPPMADLAPWNSGRRPKRSPPPRNLDPEALDTSPVVLGEVDASLSEQVAATKTDQWSIVLTGFRGEGAQASAQQMLGQVQSLGIQGAYMEQRGETWVIAYGSYESPSDALARSELNAIQGIRYQGGSPFARAMLVPPVTAAVGRLPEFDLRLVPKREGGARAKYTLQVAQYCRPDNQEPTPEEQKIFRAAAEEACVRLRREGELAFYFHGNRISTVTVGLFTEADYQTTAGRSRDPEAVVVMRRPVESEELQAARARHPYNLVNGQAAKLKSRAEQQGRLIPSMIVEIPR